MAEATTRSVSLRPHGNKNGQHRKQSEAYLRQSAERVGIRQSTIGAHSTAVSGGFGENQNLSARWFRAETIHTMLKTVPQGNTARGNVLGNR